MINFWKVVLFVVNGWLLEGVSPQFMTSSHEHQTEEKYLSLPDSEDPRSDCTFCSTEREERLIRNLHYNTSLVTWKEAETACSRDRNGSLLSLTTESESNFVPAIRRKFHPDAIWVGYYKVFEETFVPQDGELLNETEKCIALTITTISKQEIGHVIIYDLFTPPYCTDGFMALCACQTDWGTTTLKVKTTQHSWPFYRGNNCGADCQLWTPPFEEVTSGSVNNIVGKGNVTLNGLTSNLQVGFTYWVNVLARVVEKPVSGLGRIVDCGYLLPYGDNVLFGSCNEKRAFICEVYTDEKSYLTTPSEAVSRMTERQNYSNTQTDKQSADGLSVATYAGIASGSTVVLLSAVMVFVLWKRCRIQRTNNDDDFKPKGGRSFVRQNTRPSESDMTEADADTMVDNRMSMYSKIDPAHIRNTVEAQVENQYEQPDIIPTTATSGYLPMDGFQNAAFNDTYDIIESEDHAQEGNYVEVDQDLKYNDVSTMASTSYSISMETDEESVYDSTVDRHPSKKALITGNHYDRLNFTQSGSMDGNVCNSVNMEDNNYSNHHSIKLHNPTYDRVIIK